MARACLLVALVGALVGGCGSPPPTAPDPPPTGGADCGRFAAQPASPYILPYPVGDTSTVARTVEHGGPQLYAVDFLRVIGSPVVAARAGRVIEVESRWTDTDHAFGHENHVFVEHDDGTVARYFHLTENGVDVRLDERVVQGQRIGRSGDSGNSTAPHLHFDVVERRCQAPWPEGPYSDACHATLPLTFRNTRAHSCGLASGAAYAALAF